MRTYFIDDESNEHIIDLARTVVHSSDLVEYQFNKLEDNKFVKSETLMVRKLAGQYFVSMDNKRWQKLARQDMPTIALNVDTVFKVYRGFKPSGMMGGAAGELLTQMPGKVVKLLVKAGDQVKKGDTLLILEAMKMENEIKAPIDGEVLNVHVSEGQTLDEGFLMMEVGENE